MWIRSQDREKVLDVVGVEITQDSISEGFTLKGILPQGSREQLGSFNTKAEALNLLDAFEHFVTDVQAGPPRQPAVFDVMNIRKAA